MDWFARLSFLRTYLVDPHVFPTDVELTSVPTHPLFVDCDRGCIVRKDSHWLPSHTSTLVRDFSLGCRLGLLPLCRYHCRDCPSVSDSAIRILEQRLYQLALGK